MNRNEMRTNMKVAYRRSKWDPPKRAIIRSVDRSDGHGATHTISFVDDQGTIGNETYSASSRQLSDWANEAEAVEAAEFEAKKQEIANALKTAELARVREPYDHLVGLLALEGIEGKVNHNRYARNDQPVFTITIDDPDGFTKLMQPILTKRATDRLLSTHVEETSGVVHNPVDLA